MDNDVTNWHNVYAPGQGIPEARKRIIFGRDRIDEADAVLDMTSPVVVQMAAMLGEEQAASLTAQSLVESMARKITELETSLDNAESELQHPDD